MKPQMPQIVQIKIEIRTPDLHPLPGFIGLPTDADVFLAIGGREYFLDVVHRNDFELASMNTFTLGKGTTNNFAADMNDPLQLMPTYSELLADFPAWIRFNPFPKEPFSVKDHFWSIDFVRVSVVDSAGDQFQFENPGLMDLPEGSDLGHEKKILYLGRGFGNYVFLCRRDALKEKGREPTARS